MFRYFLFIFLTICFAYSQDSSQLSDSIIKYKQINPTLALDYGIQYNNLVLDIKPNNEIQQVFGAIGEILSNMGLDAAALDYLKRSIKLYEALPEKERKFPEIDQPPGVLLVIGNIYFSNGEYDKADDFFSQTISLYEKTSDQEAKFFGINTAMSNRALIKQVKKDYNGAEKIFRDVYQRRKQYGKAEDILYSMNNLLVISLLKNEIASAENLLSRAKKFLQKRN